MLLTGKGGGIVEATATARWDPKELVAPTLRYLQQPAQLLRGYNREHLRPDLIAGLTVGVVLLPQAIAFSLLAELPPQMGLYTAIVGGVVAALWGSSDQLHSGPTNALSLLILSTLVTTRTPGSADYIVAAGLLTLMVGVLQLVLGLLRLGFVVNFVSHSVIVGFATGAGALIALRQLGPLLGIRLSSDNVVDTLSSLAGQLTATDVITAGIGLGTMVVIILVRRFAPRLPGPLIGMTVAAIAVALLGERADGVAVIGALPRSLPPLTRLSVFELDTIAQLSTGALAVAAIGLVQTTAISRAVAGQTRQRLDSNQEFVGQGLASIFSALFSGYAVSGSFSCTAVNFRAGARTRVAAV
ncbi:SulP family inorganic anion transporter, partial [Promineifilum sp.]|uniref:SulP family inorganic anion transporter n=1 Tax=Promineifilum sp. TaxID=2664178 RepID=UPI0035B204A6